ncbi:hypothetical protein [Microbacterium sp. CPCC 204701]|uniref:hypothetical protein n=1 Tax=Microbacterium sp. CPCC 204701 TaxID=2493084 RepID=UPI000FDA91BF|nr:hypothetical protein [Microbacterium sp. CPCC 204701]
MVADGRVDREKLIELLTLGAEQEALDFKATLDFSNPKHQVEHVKDLLALMSLPAGGYIVVGVRNDGSLATDQPEIVEAHFDQAVLHAKVAGYVDGRLDLRSAVHVLTADDGSRRVAIIYAGPPPDLFPLVIRRSGEYTRDSGGQEVVFRVGQILVREGTATVALAPRHWSVLLSRYTEQVKAEARKDVDALVSRVVALLEQSESGGTAAPTPIDLGMNLSTFTIAANAITESRSASRLDDALREVASALVSDDGSTDDALDRAFVLALSTMLYGDEAQFARVIEVIADYYDSVPAIQDATSNTSPRERTSATAWREVAVRLYLLGAEAVRRRRWPQLRLLTLHPYDMSDSYGYSSWIRHALTSAARANVLDAEETQSGQTAALISRALNLATTAPDLVPDFPYPAIAVPSVLDDNPVLDALCQFDILWCLVAFVEGNAGHHFFPSSAAYDQRHSYPAFELVATDAAVRHALFPDSTDADVAQAIEVVADMGRRQSQHNPGFNWWDDLPDSVTRWMAQASR